MEKLEIARNFKIYYLIKHSLYEIINGRKGNNGLALVTRPSCGDGSALCDARASTGTAMIALGFPHIHAYVLYMKCYYQQLQGNDFLARGLYVSNIPKQIDL